MLFGDLYKKTIQLGSDDKYVFGGQEGGVFLQQSPLEFAALSGVLFKSEGYEEYLEFGSAAGGSAVAAKLLFNVKNCTCIDDGEHHRSHLLIENLKKYYSYDDEELKRRVFRGKSFSAECYQWLQSLNRKYDLILLDIDNAPFYKEWELINQFGKENVIVIIHDEDVVSRKWKNKNIPTVAKSYNFTRILHISSYKLLGISLYIRYNILGEIL